MNSEIKPPNFFIVGAPRCGTNSMIRYLKSHPQVFAPPSKEFHYFANDFINLQKIHFASDEEYLQMYKDVGEQVTALGDASPFHLYSKFALQRIHDFNPQARIIVMFRNPLDFVLSLHQLNVNLMRDDVAGVQKAWALQSDRKGGLFIPKRVRHVELLMYGELGLFGKYLEKVYAVFSPEQVKVVLLEDIMQDPRSVYEDVLAFLGLPSNGLNEFPRYNAGVRSRHTLLSRLMHPPQPVLDLVMKFFSLFGFKFVQKLKSIQYRTDQLLSDKPSKKTIDPAFKAELIENFKPDVMKLSKLLDRDLSHWMEL